MGNSDDETVVVEEKEVSKATESEEGMTKNEAGTKATSCENEDEENPDPYYPPIIYLPEVIVNAGEDDEVEVFKKRARLYRYAHECSPAEWKERGTGDVKILMTEDESSSRIVMRREKTLKLCANHLIVPWMELRPNCGNKKSWVWKTAADFADDQEEPKQETLAIRFGTEESAKAFEKAFLAARQLVLEKSAEKVRKEEESESNDETENTNDENTTSKEVEEESTSEKDLDQKMTGLRV